MRCPVHWQAPSRVEGPCVITVECSADEIPPFAPFLGAVSGTTINTEENEIDVRCRALEDISVSTKETASPSTA